MEQYKKRWLMAYRGFSLVEVLVASVIGGVIILGSAKTLLISMQAGGLARAVLTENDFKLTVSQALTENCNHNLSPTSTHLTGSIGDAYRQVNQLFLKDDTTNPIITVGTDFKGDMRVIRMEIRGSGSQRDFTAYYKKNNLGDLNTVGGQPCENDDSDLTKLNGCFKAQCKLNYEVKVGDNPDTAETETSYLKKCQSLTCQAVVLPAGVSRFPCPYGHVYNPGGKESCAETDTTCELKCDPRDQQKANRTGSSQFKYGNGTACKIGSTWNDTEKKCKCNTNQILSVDGRCVPKDMILEDANLSTRSNGTCWSLKDGASSGELGGMPFWEKQGTGGRQNFHTERDIFCSKEYIGGYDCFRYHYNPAEHDGSASLGNAIQNPSWIKWIKRFYNRETGQVACITLRTSGNFKHLTPSELFSLPPPWAQ